MIKSSTKRNRTPWLLGVSALLLAGCGSAGKVPEHQPGLLDDGVARFLPDGVMPEELFPSFALEEPRYPTGPVPEGWGPAPVFSVEGPSESPTHVVHVAIAPGTDLYGTGEVVGPLLRNGARTQVWTEMPNFMSGSNGIRYDDSYLNLYQAHPWVLAVRADGTAFGVLADTTRRAWIDLSDGIRFEAAAPFPVVIVQGATPDEVLRALADLTGHMDMPARWTLGHQQSRFSYSTQAEMLAIGEELREHNIPTDVLWLDGAYMETYKLFTFDEERFPDAVGMIDDLHAMDYRVVPIFDPGVRLEEDFPLYQEAVSQGLLLMNQDGNEYRSVVWNYRNAFPDFSQRATREWWTRHMSTFVRSSGFDGIWDDLNEPVVYDLVRGWYPPETVVALGDERYPAWTHAQFHNVYALQQLAASEAAFRDAYPDRRPFLLTRSNYIGGQRHSATWTGDNTSTWEHLHWSIAMIANLGLSGQPFSGADVGGFFVEANGMWDPTLFAHWIGIGVFYPFCRNHSAGLDDPFTSMFGGPTHHAWDFGPEIERVYREAVERRYRLLPYFYTAMRAAAVEGAPVFRPVFFASPGEARLRGEDRAFLFGADLLIVPQWPGGVLGDDSPLALPDGFDHEITLVGEDPDQDAAHPHIRLRNGAIVPTGVVGQTTAYDPTSALDLYLALGEDGTAQGTLYEDEGEGHGHLEGEYRVITLRAETVGGQVVVTLERSDGEMDLPVRVVRAHLYGDGGVTTATGMTDRVELTTSAP
ncbi:MAG: glycoside hydrolase family 31 protein [Polyangiales bacterium]|nr:DUF5110 domain-containing protein [Myxococcales bacterium]